MRIRSRAAALIGLGLVTGSTTADARHYDCTKPGNANKAACKTQVAALASAAGPTMAAPPAAGRSAAKADRHYDCSKPGNVNKAACKSSAASAAPASAPAPVARTPAPAAAAAPPHPAPAAAAPAGGSPRIFAWTERNGKVVHYDCSKTGSFNKKACKQ